MPNNYEKYLAGEPLNDELRELKEGRMPEFGPFWAPGAGQAAAGAAKDIQRPLTKAERDALRELRQGRGWPVLQKLLERATIFHTEAATSLSQDDPLAKSDAIAQAWAYLNLFRQAHREINALVELELAEKPEAGGKDGRTENDPALQGA